MNSNCSCHPAHGPNGPDYSKFQAVTVILNPDTVSRQDEPTKAIVFQSLPNGTLGFEQIDFKRAKLGAQEDGEVTGYYKPNPSPLAPVLQYKSNLVSLVYDDMIHVYGVTADPKSICLLSPVYMPLSGTDVGELHGKIAGCSDTKEQGWIYFQRRDSQGRYHIYEKNLNSSNDDPTKFGKTSNSWENTDVAALYDGDYRWIAYQTKGDDDGDTELQVLRLADSATNYVVKDSAKYLGKKLAAMAAAFITKNDKNMITLYFRGEGNLLYRSSSDTRDGSVSFSKPESLPGPIKLADDATLSVVPDPTRKLTVIYAVKTGGKQIKVFEDKWA
ncbi:hypothetical protein FZEAL_2169 [Fusarium zealandicum]|uniref:Fucose-specific lectin n=1 Tax=Fusarium zealandicum TaxID=1053134 RepID=A0A8H4XNU4_9HYPO|nr:hypothetical protein FZEAL_2169 [Fusarium zealandicum]